MFEKRVNKTTTTIPTKLKLKRTQLTNNSELNILQQKHKIQKHNTTENKTTYNNKNNNDNNDNNNNNDRVYDVQGLGFRVWRPLFNVSGFGFGTSRLR